MANDPTDPDDAAAAPTAQAREPDPADEDRLLREARDRNADKMRRIEEEARAARERAVDDRRERSPELRPPQRLAPAWGDQEPGAPTPVRAQAGTDGLPAAERLRARLGAMLEAVPKKYRGVSWDLPDLAVRVRCEQARTLARQTHAKPVAMVCLYGPSGTGKSTLASAIYHEYVERLRRSAEAAIERSARRAFAWTALWMPARTLALAPSRHRLGAGEAPEVERAIAADLLVLDDLGRGDEERGGAIKHVIDERDADQKTTIVTTGLQFAQLVARYDDGTARRLTEPPVLAIPCGTWTRVEPGKLRSA